MKEKPKGKFANNAQCELELQRVVVHAGIDATKTLQWICYVTYVYTPHEEPSAYVYMYMNFFSDIHICIYLYIYRHIHIYIHIHI